MMDLAIQILLTVGAYCFAAGATLGLWRLL